MGCLNPDKSFGHWFGNIHLSGPCNRSCYFCIGQHMQSLERLNNLSDWPLAGLEPFVEECCKNGVTEINLTGTNTDPFLYEHHGELVDYLRREIPHLAMGVRTNGALVLSKPGVWELYDKASVSIHSFNPIIYKKMMGKGTPPDLKAITELDPGKPVKVNIVLGPENIGEDLFESLRYMESIGIKKVNLREPYGQPHLGNPFTLKPSSFRFGMPCYEIGGISVVYWDVHYVEVESVNLYANGNVSKTYPITKGYDPEEGKVLSQEHWDQSGRKFTQWRGASIKRQRRIDENSEARYTIDLLP